MFLSFEWFNLNFSCGFILELTASFDSSSFSKQNVGWLFVHFWSCFFVVLSIYQLNNRSPVVFSINCKKSVSVFSVKFLVVTNNVSAKFYWIFLSFSTWTANNSISLLVYNFWWLHQCWYKILFNFCFLFSVMVVLFKVESFILDEDKNQRLPFEILTDLFNCSLEFI